MTEIMEAERQIHFRLYAVEKLTALVDDVCSQAGMSKASATIMVLMATGDIMEQMGGKAALKVIEASAMPRFETKEAKVAAAERKFMGACNAFYRQTDLRWAQERGPMQ